MKIKIVPEKAHKTTKYVKNRIFKHMSAGAFAWSKYRRETENRGRIALNTLNRTFGTVNRMDIECSLFLAQREHAITFDCIWPNKWNVHNNQIYTHIRSARHRVRARTFGRRHRCCCRNCARRHAVLVRFRKTIAFIFTVHKIQIERLYCFI